MAAAKKVARKKSRKRGRLRRFLRLSPEIRDYRMWAHDFDTIIHGLALNPSSLALTPSEFVLRAVDIANEMRAAQEPRRPKGYDRW